jgi:two-component system, OmpR family, phosphate regulon response regulator PhoB
MTPRERPSEVRRHKRPRKPLVVVIEDMPEARELFSCCLVASGYRVTTAEDGSSGVAAVRASRPDMVLLDYCMPRMDGAEVVRLLKADPQTRGIPLVMVTALTEGVGESTRSQLAALLEKPIDPDHLAEVLRQVPQRDVPVRACG